MEQQEARHVVVIGGGPSGLACAWRLAREGRRVTVLEAEAREGGLCATHEKDGFRFDLGGHRFVSSDTELSSRVRTWMGDDLLVRERKSAVLHEGRHFHYPLEAGDLVRSLGLAENARAMLDYALSRAQRPFVRERDRSFESWVRARFGNYLYNAFFGPYTEKLWGLAPERISADWAEERIGLLDLSDAALRMAGVRRTKIRTYARRYEYPRLGMGQLFARVAEDARRMGARIELGARVTKLVVEGRRIREVVAERRGSEAAERRRGGELRIAADAVYATSPLPEIARQLVSRGNGRAVAMPRDVDAAAARLRFRALRFLNVCLRGERVQPYTWLYVADGARRTSRIQEPSHRSEAMCPPGHASLMLEMPCDEGDALYTMPHDELLALGLGELESLGFRVADRLVSSFSVAVAAGYPVYHLAHAQDRARVLAHLRTLENLIVGGRQGLFRYVFLDRAMQMGDDAARAILRNEMRADCTEREPVRASRPLEASALLA
jgi:protoporphyrinogen oxidase